MAKCPECGYQPKVNPLHYFVAALGQGALLVLLGNVRPDEGYALWLSFMWWGTACFGVFSAVMFLIACGVRMEQETNHPSRADR